MRTAPHLVVNAAWQAGSGPTLEVTSELAATAGADGLGLPDSPRLFGDPFVQTERVLAATAMPLAGPCVLGLGLRHPAAVGAGLRTLAARHGSRVFGVLARGESGVRNEGLTPPSLAAYLAACDTVLDVLGPARPSTTMLGAASGPRTIAGTARRLGGVLIDVGVDRQMVAAALDAARSAESGIPCWLFVRAVVTDTEEQSQAGTATLLGSCAGRLAAAADWYRVPPMLRSEVAALAAAHDYRTHGRGGTGPTRDTPAQALVRERFFLTGAPAEITRRMRALTDLGLDGVVLAGATGGLLPRLADTIRALRAGLQPTGSDT